MDTFDFVVKLKVTTDAFTEEDAVEVVQDIFGPGSECGVEVLECTITPSVKPDAGIITTTTIKQR
jgi:hypothetical protein